MITISEASDGTSVMVGVVIELESDRSTVEVAGEGLRVRARRFAALG